MNFNDPREKEALDYITRNKKSGWSEEQIRQGLVQQGWSKDQVDLLMVKVMLPGMLKEQFPTLIRGILRIVATYVVVLTVAAIIWFWYLNK